MTSTAPPHKLAYSIPELAEATGLSKDSIYKAIKNEELVKSMFGTKPIILRAEAERWLSTLSTD
jgi:excisionase family DNA binding protein